MPAVGRRNGACGACGPATERKGRNPISHSGSLMVMIVPVAFTGHGESEVRASGGTADALASGASVRKGVGVQIPPRAQRETPGSRNREFFVVRKEQAPGRSALWQNRQEFPPHPLTPGVPRVTMELLAKSKCHHSIGVST